MIKDGSKPARANELYNIFEQVRIILSDNADKLTLEDDNLMTDKGAAKLYSGETKEGNLYLISSIVLDGVQYEVRVVNDKTMQDGKFVNAITKENGNYEKAVGVIVELINSLK